MRGAASTWCRYGLRFPRRSWRRSPCIGPICRGSRSACASRASTPGNGSAVHALGYVAQSASGPVAHRCCELRRYDADRQARHRARLRGGAAWRHRSPAAAGHRTGPPGGARRLSAADLERQEPMAGNDLILALDMRVQRAAEQALADKRAAVVAIDPNNGDVIAFVSTDVRSERLRAGPFGRARTRHCRTTSTSPGRSGAARRAYPPGSTIKPCWSRWPPSSTARPIRRRHGPAAECSAGAGLQPSLPRLEEARSRHGQHAQGHRRVLRHLFLRRRRPPGSTGCTTSCPGSAEETGSTSRASDRRGAVEGLEEAAPSSVAICRRGSRARR